MTLVIRLPPELESKLAAEARKRGVPLPDCALDLLKRSLLPQGAASESAEETPLLLQLLDEVHATMPEEAWDALPHDRARNYKHYLYGHAREEE